MTEKKDLKIKIQEILQKNGIKQVDLAREIGIHHSTLSLWMQNKKQGRKQEISLAQSSRIDDLLERWVDAYVRQKGQGMGTGNFRLPESKGSHMMHSSHPIKPVLPISKFHILKNQYNNYMKAQRQEIVLRKLQKLQQKEQQNHNLQSQINFCAQEIPIEPPKHMQLVPIVIDMELEGKKIYQTFSWNIHESHMSADYFARILTEENQLPSVIEQEISTQIKKQVQNFKGYYPTKNEMLKTLQVDVQLDNCSYKDQFEWDINDTMNCPEAFAEITAKELGFPQSFESKLSHQIRDSLQQIQRQIETKTSEDFQQLKKSTRTLIESSNNYQNINFKNILFSNSVNDKNWIRYEAEYETSQWGPHVEFLDPTQMKNNQSQERKTRYVRRLNR